MIFYVIHRENRDVYVFFTHPIGMKHNTGLDILNSLPNSMGNLMKFLDTILLINI